MYKKILVATDGSELAARGLDQAIAMAKLTGGEINVVTVTEPLAAFVGGYAGMAGAGFDPLPELIAGQAEAARQVLSEAAGKVGAAGVPVATTLVENTYPADGIIGTAEEAGSDLIVMGSHGRRGLGRLLLGSQTSNVLSHSKVPVLVIR